MEKRIKKNERSVNKDQSCNSPASKTFFSPKVQEKTALFDALARQGQPGEPRASGAPAALPSPWAPGTARGGGRKETELQATGFE